MRLVVVLSLSASISMAGVEVIVDEGNPATSSRQVPSIVLTSERTSVGLMQKNQPGPLVFQIGTGMINSIFATEIGANSSALRLEIRTTENLLPEWLNGDEIPWGPQEIQKHVWLLQPEVYYGRRIAEAARFQDESEQRGVLVSKDEWLDHFQSLENASELSGIEHDRNFLIRYGTGVELMVEHQNACSNTKQAVERWVSIINETPEFSSSQWARQQFSDICNAIARSMDPAWRTWFASDVLLPAMSAGFFPTNGHASLADVLIQESQPNLAFDIAISFLHHESSINRAWQSTWLNRAVDALKVMVGRDQQREMFAGMLQDRMRTASHVERLRINQTLRRITDEVGYSE